MFCDMSQLNTLYDIVVHTLSNILIYLIYIPIRIIYIITFYQFIFHNNFNAVSDGFL